MVFAANPFERLPFTPSDGRGPNPLLQNIGMVIHPPMLYLGYVGFTVPFAFAIAALVTGRLGEGWLIATRRWTLIALGASSRSASCSACGGPTRCWAGAATGRGIRWRTPASCPGSRRPRSCTR